MTLDEIYQKEDISVRSLNICDFNGLKDLDSILFYFKENKTFAKLRNCGKKSDDELSKLCLKYRTSDTTNNNIKKDINVSLHQIITNLKTEQIILVNDFIGINVNKLSNRGKNALVKHLHGELNLNKINDNILTNIHFNYNHIRSAGQKTTIEIKQFINSIVTFINTIDKINKDEVSSISLNENPQDKSYFSELENKMIFEESFSIPSLIPSVILSNNSIFKIIDFLINQNTIIDNKLNFIFKNSFKIYCNQSVLTRSEISKKLMISTERVRQLRNDLPRILFRKFEFIKILNDDLYQKYNLDISSDFLVIDSEKREHINNLNQTNFSKEFISSIICIYKSDLYEIIVETEDMILLNKYKLKSMFSWKNRYLVKKIFNTEFCFISFTNDINKRLSERINETYQFNFHEYLFNFLKTSNRNLLSHIQPIAEKILNNEFDLYIDINHNIVFNRNIGKQIYEFVIEALEKLGKPSKIDEIFNRIKNDYPLFEKSKEALRVALNRKSEIIYFGRTSTYGLKKWETENDGIKGGTIRGIAFDFLNRFSEPQHLSDISKYVIQFRPDSNKKSIYYNLKSDESRTFTFLKNSYVGLSNKRYAKELYFNYDNQSGYYDYEEEFIQYLKNNKLLSDKTIKNYTNALSSRISQGLRENFIPSLKSLYFINDKLVLENLNNQLFEIEEYKKLNIKGKNMYSCAFDNYINFISSLEDNESKRIRNLVIENEGEYSTNGKLLTINNLDLIKKLEPYIMTNRILSAAQIVGNYYLDEFPKMELSDWINLIRKIK
jgi:hypothetical protein